MSIGIARPLSDSLNFLMMENVIHEFAHGEKWSLEVRIVDNSN